jgi:hypothetical protein
MGVNTLVSVRVPRQTWDSKEDLKPSQNPLFKADTYVRSVAESGILGLVHAKIFSSKQTPILFLFPASATHKMMFTIPHRG